MKKLIGVFGGTFTAWLTGNALWIAPLVNFVWLLFKDKTLFPWIWVLYIGIAFLVSLIITLVSAVTLED